MFSGEGKECFSGARVEEAMVEEAAVRAAAFRERVSRAGRSWSVSRSEARIVYKFRHS